MSLAQEKLLPLYKHNGEHKGTISLAKALMQAQSGDVELRWKGQGRKTRITAVYEIFTRPFRPSPCTITARETERFAFVRNGMRLDPRDAISPLDKAVNKVKAWPEVHDSRATVISAGTCYGVFCPYPPLEDRVVTFA